MPAIAALLRDACVSGEVSRLDAELLLAHCLGKPRSHLYAWPEQQLDAAIASEFWLLRAQKLGGKPLAYITGEKAFWSLSLALDERVLVPRPETETLVEWALQLALPERARVSDWGTGSGAIALALASERPLWQILATDISTDSLALAAENAARLALVNLEFLHSDWDSALTDRTFELIVSNPPYIAEQDAHLNAAELRHEPRLALVSGVDGLDALRRIVPVAAQRLERAGWLLLEHGCNQAAAVRELLHNAGFSQVCSREDLAGHERISGGQFDAQ